MPQQQPSFADLGVPSDIVEALARRSIIEPFPIQAATVVDAMAGRDVCGKAPTGSGKTLAFGIGAVARLTGKPARPKHPRVLVLTPTRELAAQVASELLSLAGARNLRVESFYGGVGYGPQLKALSRGVDIAVACPGRLGDLIERGSFRLDDIEIVVIDEADRMADMGFLPEVRRILDKTPSSRQTVLFSATLDGDIDVLVKKYQHDPVRHELEAEEDASEAVHLFWRLQSGDRVETTASIAAAAGPTIVFCRTKHSTDRIARQLEQRGVRAAAIHGDRSQKQRERALESFTRGSVDALIATDVAARGIHVDGVNAVVHFDPPTDHKDYVHRSGRTARAGAIGVVVSLVTPDKAGAVKRIQRELGMPQGSGPVDLVAIKEVLGDPPVRVPSKRSAPDHQPTSERSGSGEAAGRSTQGRRSGRPPWERKRGDAPRTARSSDGARRGEADGTTGQGRPASPAKFAKFAKPTSFGKATAGKARNGDHAWGGSDGERSGKPARAGAPGTDHSGRPGKPARPSGRGTSSAKTSSSSRTGSSGWGGTSRGSSSTRGASQGGGWGGGSGQGNGARRGTSAGRRPGASTTGRGR